MIRKALMILSAMAALAVGGCSTDVAQQMLTNEQLRTQVLDTIASHKDVAMQVVDKLMASDSLRSQVVDKMLTNSEAAKQVLVRIATNREALDMVLGAAVADSSMRGHVMTLVDGMKMAAGKK